MSAERSTESIIDLLYGELSEDEARQVREDLADSAERQGDLAEFETLLGRVRETMPIEEVSPAIHASIMEAARLGVKNADDDRMIRRAAPEQGFWSRVGRGQGSQLALVAAVLIAGLFVVKAVDRGSSPLHAPAGDISSMEEAAAPMAAVRADEPAEENAAAAATGEFDKTVADDESAEGGEAIADLWTPEAEAPAEAKPEPPADVASSLRAELDATRNLEKSVEKTPAAPEPRKRAKRSAAKKSSPKPKAQPAQAPAPSTRTSARGDSFGDSLFVGEVDRDGSGRGSKDSKSTSSYDLGLRQGKAGLDAPQAAAEPVALEKKAEKEEEQRAYRAPANSISEVQDYFRAGDYGGTIKAADKFLTTNKSAPDAERASAMWVKAQSLEKQGRYNEADRVYQTIQKNYPTFSSAEIERARKEIQRKNVRKPANKSRSKSDDLENSLNVDSFGDF